VTRRERLAVLAVLVVLVAAFVLRQPVAAGFGALAGVAGGLALDDRLDRLRRRVDARLGDDVEVPRTGLRVEVVVRRVLLQVVVLAGLLVVVAFTPFAGENVLALLATAATALPAVLTAQRLRR
jgi:hypothetical protein